MDAQRSRRTRDQARKSWYAYYRQVRFARWFGFIETNTKTDWDQLYRGAPIRNKPGTWSAPVIPATLNHWSQTDQCFIQDAPSRH